MKKETAFKLMQIAGALFLAAGVTSCSMGGSQMSILFIVGGLLYGSGRMSGWLIK